MYIFPPFILCWSNRSVLRGCEKCGVGVKLLWQARTCRVYFTTCDPACFISAWNKHNGTVLWGCRLHVRYVRLTRQHIYKNIATTERNDYSIAGDLWCLCFRLFFCISILSILVLQHILLVIRIFFVCVCDCSSNTTLYTISCRKNTQAAHLSDAPSLSTPL